MDRQKGMKIAGHGTWSAHTRIICWEKILDFGSPEKPVSYTCRPADQFGNGITVVIMQEIK